MSAGIPAAWKVVSPRDLSALGDAEASPSSPTNRQIRHCSEQLDPLPPILPSVEAELIG